MENEHIVPKKFLDNLSVDFQQLASKANLLSPHDILNAKNSDFENSEDVTKLKHLKYLAATFLRGNPFTPIKQLKCPGKISFGCQSLDNCSDGGITRRGITEICGEAGTGKTQILLQLCLNAQLYMTDENVRQKVIFINTEKLFPSNRLGQIQEDFQRRHAEKVDYLDGIFVTNIRDSNDLITCCYKKLPILFQKHSIGLVIIDSIAAIYRAELDFLKRANDMRKVVHMLHNLVDKYNCAIVCSNHVVSVDDNLIPSLGIAWSHLIRTRFKLSKISNSKNRKFEILHSPELPHKSCEFTITTNGISDVEN